MFSTIAPRYDFFTHFFSLGMDGRWKHAGVNRSQLPPKPLILDLASGTGDFSLLAARRYPGARSIATDITERMLQLARGRGIERAICGDAGRLPFPDASFDCVFVGYGFRNFPNLAGAMAEIARVTRPGGSLISLDFFLPANPIFRPLFLGYLYTIGAIFGLALHGRARVYTYIPDSIRNFVSIGDFSARLRRTGYHNIDTRSYVLGGIGVHWATKEAVN